MNYSIVILFAFSLMLMGASGWPLEYFELTEMSPYLVTGMRLAIVGIIALSIGMVKTIIEKSAFRIDCAGIKRLALFTLLAVVLLNGGLNLAIQYLDDRVAMAFLFVGLTSVLIWNHCENKWSWAAAIAAILGIILLGKEELSSLPGKLAEGQYEIVTGMFLALIAGIAQGIIIAKGNLLPKTIDPGIALGAAFLLGSVGVLACVAIFIPEEIVFVSDGEQGFGLLVSAGMVVICWLVFVYGKHQMTDNQATGATSFEPVGAVVSEGFLQWKLPGSFEFVGIGFLIASSLMAIWIQVEKK